MDILTVKGCGYATKRHRPFPTVTTDYGGEFLQARSTSHGHANLHENAAFRRTDCSRRIAEVQHEFNDFSFRHHSSADTRPQTRQLTLDHQNESRSKSLIRTSASTHSPRHRQTSCPAVERLDQVQQHFYANPFSSTHATQTEAAVLTLPGFECPFPECHGRLSSSLVQWQEVIKSSIREKRTIPCAHIQCPYLSTSQDEWSRHVTAVHHDASAAMGFGASTNLGDENSYPPLQCQGCGGREIVECDRGADGPCAKCETCGKHFAKSAWAA